MANVHVVMGLYLLTLLILNGVNSSEISQTLPLNHKEPIDVENSASLKLEARSDDVPDLSEKLDASTLSTVPKVYPVYPESRSTLENKSGVKLSSSWKSLKTSSKDSYLDALDYSHISKFPKQSLASVNPKGPVTKLVRRNYDAPVYRPSMEYGSPNDLSSGPAKTPRISVRPTQDSFLPTPSDSYSLPVQQAVVSFDDQNQYGTLQSNYGAPQNSYGTPQKSYGTPQTSYGAPNQNYGPPSSIHTEYGPPQQGYGLPAQPQQAYGAPSWTGYQLPSLPQLPSFPSIGFPWPFALKLNAFTIAKIILKLVIFKMIVKFIAVICLLLFIPKLEIKNNDEENEDSDEGRLISTNSALSRLNMLTARVLESIEKYETANGTISDNNIEPCSTVSCRLKRFIISGESWNNYVNLFKSYVVEEKIEDENKTLVIT